MSTQIQNTKAPKALTLPAILAMLILLVSFIAGCATQPAAAPDPEASAAAPVEAEVTPPAPDFSTIQFGEIFTYENNVSISVSAPAPFTPSQYAAKSDENAAFVFTIVLTNNSEAAIEPYTYESVSSGGAEAGTIFDMGNDIGNVGEFPTTTVQPGQTVQWLVGYSLLDPAAITFDIQPGFEYEKTTFTNILP